MKNILTSSSCTEDDESNTEIVEDINDFKDNSSSILVSNNTPINKPQPQEAKKGNEIITNCQNNNTKSVNNMNNNMNNNSNNMNNSNSSSNNNNNNNSNNHSNENDNNNYYNNNNDDDVNNSYVNAKRDVNMRDPHMFGPCQQHSDNNVDLQNNNFTNQSTNSRDCLSNNYQDNNDSSIFMHKEYRFLQQQLHWHGNQQFHSQQEIQRLPPFQTDLIENHEYKINYHRNQIFEIEKQIQYLSGQQSLKDNQQSFDVSCSNQQSNHQQNSGKQSIIINQQAQVYPLLNEVASRTSFQPQFNNQQSQQNVNRQSFNGQSSSQQPNCTNSYNNNRQFSNQQQMPNNYDGQNSQFYSSNCSRNQNPSQHYGNNISQFQTLKVNTSSSNNCYRPVYDDQSRVCALQQERDVNRFYNNNNNNNNNNNSLLYNSQQSTNTQHNNFLNVTECIKNVRYNQMKQDLIYREIEIELLLQQTNKSKY